MSIKKLLLTSLVVTVISVLLIILLWNYPLNYPLGVMVCLPLVGSMAFPITLLSVFFVIWLPRLTRRLKTKTKGG